MRYRYVEMPASVTVPGTLSGHAADIWRAAFLSAYSSTCKGRSDRDGCAASIGWAAVKNKYHKGEDGTWIAKAEDAGSSSPAAMDPAEYPQPMGEGGMKSPAWKKEYDAALLGECAKAEDPAACASVVADGAVKRRAEAGMERGFVRLHRNDYGDLSLPLVIRKDYSPEKRAEYAAKGWALPGGSYPIADIGDLKDAIHSYGRGGDKPEIKAHIRKRARQLGALDQVGPEWASGQKSMTASEIRRVQEEDADQTLLSEGLADAIARRPDNIQSNDWMKRPLEQRTVRALIIERSIARSYEAAAEKAIIEGWQAISNPSRRDEFIFQRWVDSPDGLLLQRSVLVRRTGTIDWKMRELSRGASMSLAVQIPPHERRYGEHRL